MSVFVRVVGFIIGVIVVPGLVAVIVIWLIGSDALFASGRADGMLLIGSGVGGAGIANRLRMYLLGKYVQRRRRRAGSSLAHIRDA